MHRAKKIEKNGCGRWVATFGRLALGIKLKNFFEQLKKLSLEVCGMLTRIVHNKESTWNYFGMIFEHTLPSE